MCRYNEVKSWLERKITLIVKKERITDYIPGYISEIPRMIYNVTDRKWLYNGCLESVFFLQECCKNML